MMTSSNENIFLVAGHLWGKFTGHRWIALTTAIDLELWCFLWSAPEQTVEHTIDTPVISDATAFIMTSLQWMVQVQDEKNISSWKTPSPGFCIVNVNAVDGLVTLGTMVFICFSWINPVSAPASAQEGLISRKWERASLVGMIYGRCAPWRA